MTIKKTHTYENKICIKSLINEERNDCLIKIEETGEVKWVKNSDVRAEDKNYDNN